VPEVFVNYRTGDEEGCATMIERELSRRFGSARIFLASRSIKPGSDYTHELLAAVRASSVLLAVIGTRWRSDALDTEDDWVRKEILAAFDVDIPVVPILVGRAERLRRVDLPRPLGRLADIQYIKFDTRNAERDLRDIGDKLIDLVPDLVDLDATAEPETAAPQGNVTTVTGDIRGNVNTGSGPQINGAVGRIGQIGDRFGGEPNREADRR